MRYRHGDKEFLKRLGSHIRELRQQHGWSQDHLASECGLHRTYVGAVERGERNIAVINLRRISDALGIPLSELLADISQDPKSKKS